MADNSKGRKKALLISMLAFLLVGGSIFLFFVVQGADELTGKNKNKSFSYGDAAREGVSSFFKSVGIFPQSSEEQILEKRKEDILAAHGFNPDGRSMSDISDWMDKGGQSASASASASRPSAPTKISQMSQKAMSGVGGLGGAGSKSSAGLSRFGEGSGSGETSVSGSAAHAVKTGAADKATLASLKNTRALLSQGLQSGSAMTAKDKWNQSFGAGGSKSSTGGQLAYNKSGLVGLDKIKSGGIESLKMDKAGNFGAPDVPKMGNVTAASEIDQDPDTKKKMGDQMKENLAKDTLDAAGNAMRNGLNKPTDAKDGKGDPQTPDAPITQEEKDIAKSLIGNPKALSDGSTFVNSAVVIERNPDGGATFTIKGTVNPPPGSTEPPMPYTLDVIKNKDGSVHAGEFAWK